MAQTKAITRLYFAKIREAFRNLSSAEQKAFMRKDRENLDELGMKSITMIDCSGSNDEWDWVGVEEWPSLEAIQARERFENEQLEVHKYVESKTMLGTAAPFDDYGRE